MIIKKTLSAMILGLCIFGTTQAQSIDESYIRIASIQIIGNQKYPEKFLRFYLPFSENDKMSLTELNRKIVILKERLTATNDFLFVDIYYEETGSSNDINIVVSVAEDIISMSFAYTNIGQIILFRQFPFHYMDWGIIFGEKTQGGIIGSSAIVPYLNIYSYFGRTGEKNADQYPGIDRVTYENLFGGLILEWKFTPEISASVSNFYNNNKIKNITNSIIKPASYEKHSHDLTTGAGLSIDYKYLENICLLGFENKIEWKYGYFKYDYHDISNDLRLYLKPFFFSEFMFRSYVQHISGNYPFYRTPGVEGILSIRGPLSGKRAGKIGFVYNIEHRFVNLIKIPVYLCKLNITPVMFFDSGMAVDKSDQINIKKFYRVIGGGIYLYFTKPVNLPVHIDYGYEPENKKGKLFFYMEGMF